MNEKTEDQFDEELIQDMVSEIIELRQENQKLKSTIQRIRSSCWCKRQMRQGCWDMSNGEM